MTDAEYLKWLKERLVNVYGESPNVDWIHRLQKVIDHFCGVGTRKTVFICHPLSGNVRSNVLAVLEICNEVHSPDVIPIAPYIACTQYLDDSLEIERQMGIWVNHEHLVRGFIDELGLYGNRVSTGMKQEIQWARDYGIPVVAKTEQTQWYLDHENADHPNRNSR